MNKRTMKKGLAIVLALVMVFAMTATAFASTNTDILVNVTIDTRTLSRSAVFMSKTDGTALGTTPVVTTTVSVPSGSNVLTVLNAAKTALGTVLPVAPVPPAPVGDFPGGSPSVRPAPKELCQTPGRWTGAKRRSPPGRT